MKALLSFSAKTYDNLLKPKYKVVHKLYTCPVQLIIHIDDCDVEQEYLIYMYLKNNFLHYRLDTGIQNPPQQNLFFYIEVFTLGIFNKLKERIV